MKLQRGPKSAEIEGISAEIGDDISAEIGDEISADIGEELSSKK